jgi:hypothetical protein
MDLGRLLRRRTIAQTPPDARAESAHAQTAMAVKAVNDGRFMEAIGLLERSINELVVLGQPNYLAEALVTRSQMLDDALSHSRHLDEYAALKRLAPGLSMDLRRSTERFRLSTDKLSIALHSVAGYMDAIALYKRIDDKRNRATTEASLKTAMVRACAFQNCRNEPMFWREYRKMFRQLRRDASTNISFLEAEENAAITSWDIAFQLTERATR